MDVTGSKRKNRLLTPQEMSMEEENKPVKHIAKVTPWKDEPSNAGIKHLEDENKHSRSCCFSGKTDDAIRAAATLHENAEKIISMVKKTGAGENDLEDPDFISRRKGDELITCLGNIISMLSDPCFDAVRDPRG